ncbi:lipid-transfer protein [Pseudomonas sp. C2B4]|uniref:thiolase C-terminal domain-containing protein n=1 Tax=Pseudomonas sp. C2B4 TaxID=2735270 RepID=UPI001585F087|nr:lipid-transfer protein [Pseudomonas sp. C2B4]NUU38992.1 lipid-transfer protein [Pseudomonas sp. C2B4]
MQRCVNVIGVGMSPFRTTGLGPDPTVLVSATIRQALTDASVSASNIATVHAVSRMMDGVTLQRALQRTGLAQTPLCHFPEGGADDSNLFARACQAIALGQAESILVLGVQSAAATPVPDLVFERLGATARAYMARYRARRETFAMITVKARQHAALNPLAAFTRALTLEQVLDADTIAEPLTQPQFAWTSSGVAAVLLCSSEFARRHCSGPVVRIAAQACISPQQVTGPDQGSTFAGVDYDVNVAAALELYEQAGRGPEDVAVCELHDTSTVSELLLYEALGFCPEGRGEKMVEDGDNTTGGNLVVNPSGGLLSLGQASAASSLAQCIELVHHLRGSAGRRQVADAQLALQQQAGSDGTVTTTLYQRD